LHHKCWAARKLKPDVLFLFRHRETIRHTKMYPKMYLLQHQEDSSAANRGMVEFLRRLLGVLALSLLFFGLQLAAMLEAGS